MKVIVGGVYQTKFGELWDKNLTDLIFEAGSQALADARIKPKQIDLVVVGNKLGGKMQGQDHLASLTTELLGIEAPGVRVEAACASGGMAVHQAIQAIRAGEAERVLVIGAEKMTDATNGEVGAALMGAASNQERRAGLSFVGLYALMARAYMEKYGAKREDLVRVGVKNHEHASLNPKAQFQFKVSLEQAKNSQMVAEPLGLFDCSPITDGAAAVVLLKQNGVRVKRQVEILASQMATDSLGLTERDSLVEIRATKWAAKRAYREAGIETSEVDLAEVHDCFSIAEILAVEDLGFSKKGDGFKELKKGRFGLKGELPVNLSGGLKACGHPVGATGVKQIVEIVTQLRGEAGDRQAKKGRVGLAHNVGGTGGTATVHILRKI